jgi:hypothetical protein
MLTSSPEKEALRDRTGLSGGSCIIQGFDDPSYSVAMEELAPGSADADCFGFCHNICPLGFMTRARSCESMPFATGIDEQSRPSAEGETNLGRAQSKTAHDSLRVGPSIHPSRSNVKMQRSLGNRDHYHDRNLSYQGQMRKETRWTSWHSLSGLRPMDLSLKACHQLVSFSLKELQQDLGIYRRLVPELGLE